MPGVGMPRWKVELLKVRNGVPGEWIVEWADGRLRCEGALGAAGSGDGLVAGGVRAAGAGERRVVANARAVGSREWLEDGATVLGEGMGDGASVGAVVANQERRKTG